MMKKYAVTLFALLCTFTLQAQDDDIPYSYADEVYLTALFPQTHRTSLLDGHYSKDWYPGKARLILATWPCPVCSAVHPIYFHQRSGCIVDTCSMEHYIMYCTEKGEAFIDLDADAIAENRKGDDGYYLIWFYFDGDMPSIITLIEPLYAASDLFDEDVHPWPARIFKEWVFDKDNIENKKLVVNKKYKKGE